MSVNLGGKNYIFSLLTSFNYGCKEQTPAKAFTFDCPQQESQATAHSVT